MSTSEIDQLLRRLDDIAENASGSGESELTNDQLRHLVSVAVRLYASTSEAAPADITPLDPEVSITDAVVMACALLKTRDLNPFDLALWFSRTRVAG